MIEFAMITAPREIPTLKESAESFVNAFPETEIHIFAEPGNYSFPSGHAVHFNPEKLGCFKNFNQALQWLITHSKKRFVCVLSDDSLYAKNTNEILMQGIQRQQKHYAAYSLFTARQNIKGRHVPGGWIEINPGWYGWGGAFVMPIDVARQVVNTRFYRNHLLNYQKNEQIDACMYESFRELHLPSYVHNPSLCKHIGETSTLGHKHLAEENQGLNFVE